MFIGLGHCPLTELESRAPTGIITDITYWEDMST